jgi:zinc D-Ala-D-Ala carboxypeptidase
MSRGFARLDDEVTGTCTDKNHKGIIKGKITSASADHQLDPSNKGIARLGDTVLADCGHVAYINSASDTVITNNRGAARQDDTVGSYNDSSSPYSGKITKFSDDVDTDDNPVKQTPDLALTLGDETDVHEPGSGSAYVQGLVASGAIDGGDLSAPVTQKESDEKIPETSPPIKGSCSGFPNPFPTGNAIDSIKLTDRYTVGMLTRSPHVVFDHALREGTGGLSVSEICCNLKYLAENCIEPILDHYSGGKLTNTWRPAGIGSSKSQHPKGQAADIQFGLQRQTYGVAQWIKDNLTYDQLLLEYKTTGTGLPWIHISFNKDGNRRQVLTLLNDKVHGQGLILLGQN